ncbi:hypothetical protein [Adlercreutzia shanghongiae]|uniref:Uncharacterized protein n=1 Tax=Adlercreutzia shanghongiae TaxID=3111773 RepID=A0ABU6IY57_9ACTN|nr:hypothetical protein [Adlercreutzia sp. R22]MEC4294768.1 hypothetical protein [Adlercreutzia sp. R22]
MALTFADAVKMNPKAFADDVSVFSVSDIDLRVKVFAVARKDNPNAALKPFLSLWADALVDQRHAVDSPSKSHRAWNTQTRCVRRLDSQQEQQATAIGDI